MTSENTVIQPLPFPVGKPLKSQVLPSGVVLDGLEIAEVLGVGGFGIVYKAWDPALERHVALKEYFPQTLAWRTAAGQVQVQEQCQAATYEAGLKSFINEARLLAQFDHPSLVKVYRFWEMNGTAYLVMPLYRGVNLQQYQDRNPAPVAQGTLLRWIGELTRALEVMHAQQCVHRDVSPENILILEDTQMPVLLDFGAARRAIGQKAQPFTVILKTSYAPVEQYAELPSMEQGPWTDVYALAAVSHRLMTGKTPPAAVGRMVNDSYCPLACMQGLPYDHQVLHAVDMALKVQPDERTQDMAQFRSQLCDGLRDDGQRQKNALNALDDLLAEPQPADDLSLNSRQRRYSFLKAVKTSSAPTLLLPVVGLIAVFLAAIIAVLFVLPMAPEVSEQDVAEEPKSLTQSPANEVLSNNLVDSRFQEVLDAADETLRVETENTVLRVGKDLLRFKVHSPIDGFISVFVLSSDKHLIRILPNARVPELTGRAGEELMLPPANEPIQAAGPAGVNQILVMITEKKRNHDPLDLQDLYGFGLVGNPSASLLGISPCVPSTCTDRMAAAWFPVEEVE